MVLAEKRQSLRHSHLRTQTRPLSRPRARLKAVVYIKIVGVILFGFAFGLFYIYKHSQVAAIGYQIESTKQSIAALQRENKRLELMVAELQSPERVEEIARSKLGMKEPADVVLAALPAEASLLSESEEAESKEAQLEQDKERANALTRVAEQLIGRAEASPR